MFEYFVNFSTWAEGNSGQIQIVIAVVALILAIFGYKQLIQQRSFELRIMLSTRISSNFIELREISDSCNKLSQRLYAFSLDVQKNHPESFAAIDSMVTANREPIAKWWEFINDEFNKNKEYKKVKTDFKEMEMIIEQLESKQNEYNVIWNGIKNINKTIDSLWIPLNSADLYEANRRLNELN